MTLDLAGNLYLAVVSVCAVVIGAGALAMAATRIICVGRTPDSSRRPPQKLKSLNIKGQNS